jgi:hypothetical protein
MKACKEVTTIPQYSGTCWFNALMMALFYSDGMRHVLLSKIHEWDDKQTPKKIFKDILQHHYSKSKPDARASLEFFDKFRPEVILKELYKHDPDRFIFNPDIDRGYVSSLYVNKLFPFLYVKDYVIVDGITKGRGRKVDLHYSLINGIKNEKRILNHATKRISYTIRKLRRPETLRELARTPELLLVRIPSDNSQKKHEYPLYYFKESVELLPRITYNNAEYVVDSMTLGNFNQGVCKRGHEICGVTCNGERFMYNGWVKFSDDPAMTTGSVFRYTPCALMKHDWMNAKQAAFCIDASKCDLKFISKSNVEYKEEVCFSYGRGERMYTYIRADLLPRKQAEPKIVTKANAVKPAKECKPDEVLNMDTKRCVKKTGRIGKKIMEDAMKSKTTSNTKKEKVCAPDEVLNMETKRCVKKTGRIGKKIMEDAMKR